MVDTCKGLQGTRQYRLNLLQTNDTLHTELIVHRRERLESYGAICRETRSSLYLEQERLSRSVVDFVFEWKRGKSEY